jgi:hypothetical protein
MEVNSTQEELFLEPFRSLAVIKYAQSAIELIVFNGVPTLSARYVMGLKKTRAFLVEREKPWWHTKNGGSPW